jgi:hypothetical protein
MHTDYGLAVKNEGTKTCRELRWTLQVPSDFLVKVSAEHGCQINPGAGVVEREHGRYLQYEGQYLGLVFPAQIEPILQLKVGNAIDGEQQKFKAYWALISEDGRNPSEPDQLGELDLVRRTFIRGAGFEGPDQS